MRILRVWAFILATGCRHAPQTTSTPAPDFKAGVWRIRLQADSTPTRRLPHNPVVGTVDFMSGLSDVDFRLLIGRGLSRRAEIRAEHDSTLANAATVYRIILGELGSDIGKIVLLGKAIRPDSLVGTWSETVLCCSAAGTFALWRVPR